MAEKLIGKVVLYVPLDEPDKEYPLIIVIENTHQMVDGWVFYPDGLRLVKSVPHKKLEIAPHSWHERDSDDFSETGTPLVMPQVQIIGIEKDMLGKDVPASDQPKVFNGTRSYLGLYDHSRSLLDPSFISNLKD